MPDLAGWRRERMPTIPSVAAFELRPDIAVRAEPFEAVDLDMANWWLAEEG